ncbi:MAG: helix-turn-helix transcriptional regulator [Bacteroidia bacterium]|nr:helix-turn-helix transcriptional regulator [Bacteroidia bacterium]
MNTKKKYPNQLRRHRLAKGLSYKQVARHLNINNQSVITEWERGNAMPTGLNLLKMMNLYNAEASSLYGDFLNQLQECSKPQKPPTSNRTTKY